jgi:hypothetical protein
MSVLDLDQFDFVSIHKDGYVVLTISDHLDWNEEEEHLYALEIKINNYLEAIDSGQLVAQYPGAEGKHILIQIIAQFPPNEGGYSFLRSAKETLNSGGIELNIGFIQNGTIVIEEIS